MTPLLPRRVLHVVVRLGRSRQRSKRVASQTSSDDVSEATCSPAPTRNNSEIRVLDDAIEAPCDATEERPTSVCTRRVMLRLDGSRRAFSHRRRQFVLWRSQAASTAVNTLRGCYTLARRELASWRSRAKAASAGSQGRGSAPSDANRRSRRRVSISRYSFAEKRTRPEPRDSAASSSSVVSSLSSTTDLEEERRKDIHRSEYSLDAARASIEEQRNSQYGFAETSSDSHERLLLVHALPLNDEDEDDSEDAAPTTRHLPFRSTLVDGKLHLLRNEWV
jgi:hypothetical protein